jgi:hypothetical protein
MLDDPSWRALRRADGDLLTVSHTDPAHGGNGGPGLPFTGVNVDQQLQTAGLLLLGLLMLVLARKPKGTRTTRSPLTAPSRVNGCSGGVPAPKDTPRSFR